MRARIPRRADRGGSPSRHPPAAVRGRGVRGGEMAWARDGTVSPGSVQAVHAVAAACDGRADHTDLSDRAAYRWRPIEPLLECVAHECHPRLRTLLRAPAP